MESYPYSNHGTPNQILIYQSSEPHPLHWLPGSWLNLKHITEGVFVPEWPLKAPKNHRVLGLWLYGISRKLFMTLVLIFLHLSHVKSRIMEYHIYQSENWCPMQNHMFCPKPSESGHCALTRKRPSSFSTEITQSFCPLVGLEKPLMLRCSNLLTFPSLLPSALIKMAYMIYRLQ